MNIEKAVFRRPDGTADSVPQAALLQPFQHLHPDGKPLQSQLSDRRIRIINFQKISVIYTVGAPHRPSRDAKDLFRLNVVTGRKICFHIRFAVFQNPFHFTPHSCIFLHFSVILSLASGMFQKKIYRFCHDDLDAVYCSSYNYY